MAQTGNGSTAKAAGDMQRMKLHKAGKAFELLAGCEVKLHGAACRCTGDCTLNFEQQR
jgi:hypothetical protein